MTARAILLAGLAAMLPPLACPAWASDGTITGETSFTPPQTQQVLTRTLWRSLPDGKQIVVRRRYAVRFAASADGYRLEGRQLDVTVEAPEPLAALAAIERQRIDDDMFPLRLDARGRIASAMTPAKPGDASSGTAAAPVAAALALSRGMVRASTLPAASQNEAILQLERMAAMAGGQWPADLFSPAGHDRRERLEIPLPNGGTGVVEIALHFVHGQSDQAPSTVERTITTRFEGVVRTSREEWLLGPA